MSDSPLIRTLLAVVPVLTATLYLMGLSYHEGFLDAYGVDSSLFPLASDVALLNGFFTLIIIGLNPFINTFLVILSLALMLFLAAILSSHSRFKSVQTRVRLCLSRFMPTKEVSDIIDKGSTGYLYISGTFLFILLPFFIASQSLQSGQKQAKIYIDKFNTQTGKWVLLYSSLSTLPIKAQQITCSNTHCAFWLGNEALILAHDKIDKIVARTTDN